MAGILGGQASVGQDKFGVGAEGVMAAIEAEQVQDPKVKSAA